jgi:PilZ domain
MSIMLFKVRKWLGLVRKPYNRKLRRMKGGLSVTLLGPRERFEARSVDASASGIGVIAPHPLEVGALLYVRLNELNLVTFAHVRYCRSQAEGGFAAGLEFRDPLRRDRVTVGGWTYHLVPYEIHKAWDVNTEYGADAPHDCHCA